MLDFSSLLLAAALSGTCLSITLLAIWFTTPMARFVLTVACGMLVLVAHVVLFWQYARDPGPWLCQAVLALLSLGFLIICLSAMQYLGVRHYRSVVLPTVAAMAVCAAVTYFGLDGVGFILTYVAVTALLTVTGVLFWIQGGHDRRILLVVSFLSGTCALSFGLCAAVLARQGTMGARRGARQLGRTVEFRRGGRLHDRARRVDALAAPSAGADRIEGRDHDRPADRADEPAGADVALWRARLSARSCPIVMFDLDNFKRTNDVFGHPVGDEVLCRFAAVIRKYGGPASRRFGWAARSSRWSCRA